MALQLKLFGDFEVLGQDQTVIALPTRRTGELLARLTLAGDKSLERGEAASEIWPFVPLDAAKQSLRKSLSFIRSTLGDVVLANGSGLRIAAGVETDLTRVKAALFRAKLAADGESAALELTEIDKLTEKPLLSGWDSEWIEPFRSEWKDVRFSTLLKLSDHHKHFRQIEAALNFALSASQLEPYSEAAAARVLAGYEDLGRFEDAEGYFREFAERLEEDLDISPSRDLVEVIRQMRSRKMGISKSPATPQPGILSLLIGQVYQDNPAHLVDMLASEGLSWLVYTKAHEVLPIFVRAAESVDTWNESHRRVVKDLLALASFVYDLDLLKKWAGLLAENSEAGSYDDVVAACMKARWMTAEGDLGGSIDVLDSASRSAVKLENGYLESIVLANKALCHFLNAEYQTSCEMMEAQLGSLVSSTTRRGRLALAEAHTSLAQFRLMTGELDKAKSAIDECWKIVSVADIGGLETGRTSLRGLIDLLIGEDTSGRCIVDGLAASVQHRNSYAILTSLVLASAGLKAIGKDAEANQLVETVQGLADQLGAAVHPAHKEFLAKHAGVETLSPNPQPLFEGNMPRIVAWVYDQFSV